MVLDVTVAGDRLGHVPLELAEDQPVRLVQDVRQDVEPAPVGHAHDDLLHPQPAGSLDDPVQQRDEHLAAFQREPLLAHEVLVQERLEQLGFVELVDDPALLLDVEAGVVPDRLHPLEEPAADLQVADVHELDADRPAVCLAEDAEDLAQGAVVLLAELAVEVAVEVRVGEPEVGQLQLLVGLAAGRELQGVQVGQVVAHLAVGVDQAGDGLDRLLGRRRGVAVAGRLRAQRLGAEVVPLEEVAPRLVHRVRVVAPEALVLFDKVQVRPAHRRRACHRKGSPGRPGRLGLRGGRGLDVGWTKPGERSAPLDREARRVRGFGHARRGARTGRRGVPHAPEAPSLRPGRINAGDSIAMAS